MSLEISDNSTADSNFIQLLFSVVLLSALALGSWLFVYGEVNQDTALLFTRYTARVSFVFFLPVFVIHSLHTLMPGTLSRFLMPKRRQLGLSFALAHLIHLVAIILYFYQVDQWFVADDIPALAIYFFIGLMAITSNSFSIRRLKGGWKVIHWIGLYGVFTGFFVTYLGRVQGYDSFEIEQGLRESYAVYVTLLTLVSMAWLIRIAAFWKTRVVARRA